ncbi:LysR family transcriptional regulator [Cellvibrio sp. KY-GH-1]|uniref:LysR family transcriptional regulator n=1 Tax=Cellvibrio sp. KY-GH-1 TaxID=2303332 RepID=UPI001248EAB7|nr:LysR family transcriptional regulator [Cellvibrio sp. KY-GH-1]QEY15265.1 LysR family transcriptional regulator [Cellvibrio sp. KY-GH-1]
METLSNLESFVRSAESGSFSAAARRLGMTPAAVSRNVAQLETNLGVRLFQRSTRNLILTEAGERFLQNVRAGLDGIQGAIADITTNGGQPAGTLRISLSPGFGMDYVLPLMGEFLQMYPAVTPELHFENRAVDLIAEGFDAAIGGGFELTPGLVARELARAQLVAVASPAYMSGRKNPKHPRDLAGLDHITMRSSQTGRVRPRSFRNSKGEDFSLEINQAKMLTNEPDAMTRAALLGYGVAVIATPHAIEHFQSGALVRLVPDWYCDLGLISLYFSNQKLLPPKTRAFVDFVVGKFREQKLAEKFLVSSFNP